MPTNDAAAPAHVCPGIRIHAIDISQPPGIGIPPTADIDLLQTIVIAALAAKSNAEALKKARSENKRRDMIYSFGNSTIGSTVSALAIHVVVTPPDALLVAPLRCAIEPLVHAPESIETTRVR